MKAHGFRFGFALLKSVSVFSLGLLMACGGAKYERGVVPFAEAESEVSVHVHPFDGDQVTVVIGVRAGSAHDPVGQEGLAWLTAEQVRNSGELRSRISELGGRLAVDIGGEVVVFTLEVPTVASADAVAVLAESLVKPVFSEESFEVSKAESVQWLNEGLGSSAARLAEEAFGLWVYQGHPYGHAAQGRAGVLATLTLQDVQRFFERRYIRPALAIAHTGNLPEEAARTLQATLSQRPARLYTDVTPRPISPVRDLQVMAVIHPGSASGVYLGHPIDVKVGDMDWAALIVARAAIAPAASLDALIGEGHLQHTVGLWFSADTEQSPRGLLDAAITEVSTWVSEGVDEAAFEAAKRRLLARIENAQAVPGTALKETVEGVLLRHPDSLSALRSQLESLALADVNAVLAERVDPGALRVVVLANGWKSSTEPDKNIGATHIVQAEGLFR